MFIVDLGVIWKGSMSDVRISEINLSISYGSKGMFKVNVDNRQTDRLYKNNMSPIIRL